MPLMILSRFCSTVSSDKRLMLFAQLDDFKDLATANIKKVTILYIFVSIPIQAFFSAKINIVNHLKQGVLQGFGMAGFYLEFMRVPVLKVKPQPSAFFEFYSVFTYFGIVLSHLFLTYPLIVSLTDLTTYQCITSLRQILKRYRSYLVSNLLIENGNQRLGNQRLFIKLNSG